MKLKKLIALFAATLVIPTTCLLGCQKDVANNDSNTPTQSAADERTATEEPKPTEEPEPTEEPIKTIKVGKKMKNEDCEIKVKKIEFSSDVLPDDTSGFYSHYEADKGKIYIHIDVDVKNLAKNDLSCDEVMSVVADYNNGYTYNSFAVVESKNTGFTYSNISSIDPLETLGMRFLIECPEEVKKGKEPLILNFKLNSEGEYKYKMR